MKTLLKELRISVLATLAFALICCGAYPLLVWAGGQLLFPHQANGSLIAEKGRVVGSALVGQGFSGAAYFQPRPSDAGNGYDGMNSGGSNLGPTSQKLVDTVRANAENYRRENGLAPGVTLPADAVEASASGLDPDISPANALLQAPRVARERHAGLDAVLALVKAHTQGPTFGIFGDSRVNVLELNLDLDAKFPLEAPRG